MKQGLVFLVVLACVLVSPAQKQPTQPAAPSAKPAADSSAQLYHNATLGFRYQIPYGWVERTSTMQRGNDAAKGEVLLAVFERPPEATGEGVNSAVVIAAESTASYPGLRNAADYVGPLKEVAAARGFKAAADPTEITIDGRSLIRADFTRPLTTSSAASPAAPATTAGTSSHDTLTMWQSTLVFVAKGKIVSFTFLANTSDEVDQLIENLSFGSGRPASETRSKH
jgi:hypothetical protein